MIVWHMGALHPFETGLTLLLAFGPFVLLGVVVMIRRRQDAAEASTSNQTPTSSQTPAADAQDQPANQT